MPKRQLCAHCKRQLPHGKTLYCSGSCKTLAHRVKKKEIERVLRGVGFTASEVVNIVEAVNTSTLTRLLTAMGLVWDVDAERWRAVDLARWLDVCEAALARMKSVNSP